MKGVGMSGFNTLFKVGPIIRLISGQDVISVGAGAWPFFAKIVV